MNKKQIKVSDILEFLNEIAPFETAEDYDNVGLIVGNSLKKVERIMVCLDVSSDVVHEAIHKKCDLIVSHHPIIFSSLKKINEDNFITSKVMKLIKNDISVIAAHTNLDMAKDGVCDNLCKALGLSDKVYDGGCFKICEVSPVSVREMALKVKEALNMPFTKFSDGGKMCRKIGVVCGSGMDFADEMISMGADTIITGDIKYIGFLENMQKGINVIDCGHFDSEVIIKEPLKEILENKFDVEILVAENENYINYV